MLFEYFKGLKALGFVVDILSRALGRTHQGSGRCLSHRCHHFLPVTFIAHASLSAARISGFTRISGSLSWIEEGIYSSFVLRNSQKAWEHAHTCTGPAQFLHL